MIPCIALARSFMKVAPTSLYKEAICSPEFPSYPHECMTRSQTPVVTCSLAITLTGLLPFVPFHAVGFHPYCGLSFRTTTIHVSGLNTDPASLIHLASDSRYRVCPQFSLLPCRLSFGQAGLGPDGPHPLGIINQFQSYLLIPHGFGFIWARGTDR